MGSDAKLVVTSATVASRERTRRGEAPSLIPNGLTTNLRQNPKMYDSTLMNEPLFVFSVTYRPVSRAISWLTTFFRSLDP